MRNADGVARGRDAVARSAWTDPCSLLAAADGTRPLERAADYQELVDSGRREVYRLES